MRNIVAVVIGAALAPAALATEVVIAAPVQAPTLSEIGLGALVVIMAAVAGWMVRKRR